MAIRLHFRNLLDPRRPHRQRHHLLEIIVVALCAVICGAESWEDVETYGNTKLDWLTTFLPLPNGIPSHDTFERLFARLRPLAFQRCVISWLHAVCHTTGLKHIAIDGKTARGTFDPGSAKSAFHLVSAWATDNHLTLGQVAVDPTSNELTAVPELLKLLDVSGAVVTLDAMHCQKATTSLIRDGGGDYVVTVTDNQGRLHDDIKASFAAASDAEHRPETLDEHATVENGHGRHETRVVSVLTDLAGIRDQANGRDLRAIVMVYRERVVKGKATHQVHYYIGRRAGTAAEYAGWIRGHWGIENSLHWVLDVTFGEDASRYRVGHGATNMALLRRVAVSVLKNNARKGSVHRKQLMAGWDDDFLAELLTGTNNNPGKSGKQ